VQNAAWVLRLMWQKHDQKRRESCVNTLSGLSLENVDGGGGVGNVDINDDDDEDYDNTFDWVDELDESRLDWLFI
jgi:hypothetical protein